MPCGIYKITNLINNHSYIGQSININRRWYQEKTKAFQSDTDWYNSPLSQAFRKYGIENFSFEILEECSADELNNKEIYYIEKYNTYQDGYNRTTGGDGALNLCQKISKEDLKEIYDLLLNTDIPQKDIAQRYNVGQDVISTINHGKSRRQNGYTYPLRNLSEKTAEKMICPKCGGPKHSTARYCQSCRSLLDRKVERPNREELKNLIREKSFVEIGRNYNVTDNAIRKWCISENLPSRKSEIKKYSEEEWRKL